MRKYCEVICRDSIREGNLAIFRYTPLLSADDEGEGADNSIADSKGVLGRSDLIRSCSDLSTGSQQL